MITLVVLFAPEEWDGPRTLHEMMSTQDPDILKNVADYKINLIEPAAMGEADLDKLHSSLRLVLGFIKYSNNNEELDAFISKESGLKELDVEAPRVIWACCTRRWKLMRKKRYIMRKMKEITRKLLSVILVMALIIPIIPAQNVSAAKIEITNKTFKNGGTYTVYVKERNRVKFKQISDEVISVESSDPSVLGAKKSDGSLVITGKKVGTSVITCKYPLSEDETFTVTATIKVAKLNNPFRVLKAGGKNYLSQVVSCENYITDTQSSSERKIEFKLKKGCKLVSAKYYPGEGKVTKIKSGSTVRLSHSWSFSDSVRIVVKNKQKKKIIVDIFLY